MNFKGLRVLIPDAYSRQVPNILYQLRLLQCEVTTVSSSKFDPGYASRYADKKHVVSGLKDDSILRNNTISQFLATDQYDVVLPITEPVTEFLLNNVASMNVHTRVAAAPLDAFVKAYDKMQTLNACRLAGVPHPLTRMDSETVEEYVAHAKFPLALKPRKAAGSIGFCKVDNTGELYDLIRNGKVVPENYVIQEFIPQTDIQYVNYVFIDDAGKAKASLVAEKLRWFPIDGGSATLLRTTRRPDIEVMSQKLLKTLRWRGYCQVGYINDPRDNTPKILEINGRIPASIKLCHLSGINVIQQMIELAYGAPVTSFLENQHIGQSLRYFQTDFLWLLKSPNRFKTKPSWFNFHQNHDYIFSWRDPWPFFAYSLRGIERYGVEMQKRDRTLKSPRGGNYL